MLVLVLVLWGTTLSGGSLGSCGRGGVSRSRSATGAVELPTIVYVSTGSWIVQHRQLILSYLPTDLPTDLG